ncbi:hypothetical protein C2R22_03835 [Salinigranum rubrum]|uniref:Uncharacterized protein n=1 Tax=Salinigranum rubrum TaxID=755307 RepID=A0A2I8VG77_9EURY|nr:hypothetical protein [Salinigranum rubrum]AUV80894.1 hypothetical protein C2R22_03835 [Salinigranum rubrum]
MSKTDHQPTGAEQVSVYEQYVLDVRVVELSTPENDEPRYRFEAPQHRGVAFDDPEMATLYADVYFCVNGFEEAGTGERGIPPVVVAAGRAVLASYMLTQPGHDELWVASFFGKKPYWVDKYTGWVRERAEEIRAGAEKQGLQ